MVVVVLMVEMVLMVVVEMIMVVMVLTMITYGKDRKCHCEGDKGNVTTRDAIWLTWLRLFQYHFLCFRISTYDMNYQIWATSPQFLLTDSVKLARSHQRVVLDAIK